MSFALEVQVGREPGPPGAIALRMALPVPSRFPPRMAPLFLSWHQMVPRFCRVLGWGGRIELRNVVAEYPFERSHRFPAIQPNSDRRAYLRCDDGGPRSVLVYFPAQN